MNSDRILHQIDILASRIFELNEKIDATISPSELNKIQKRKKKLMREKQKLYDKLYPPVDNSIDSNVTLDSENIDL